MSAGAVAGTVVGKVAAKGKVAFRGGASTVEGMDTPQLNAHPRHCRWLRKEVKLMLKMTTRTPRSYSTK